MEPNFGFTSDDDTEEKVTMRTPEDPNRIDESRIKRMASYIEHVAKEVKERITYLPIEEFGILRNFNNMLTMFREYDPKDIILKTNLNWIIRNVPTQKPESTTIVDKIS